MDQADLGGRAGGVAWLVGCSGQGLMFSVDGLFHQGPNGAVITVQGAGIRLKTLV